MKDFTGPLPQGQAGETTVRADNKLYPTNDGDVMNALFDSEFRFAKKSKPKSKDKQLLHRMMQKNKKKVRKG